MSNLNWRCCAKNLKRYRKNVEILMRVKAKNKLVALGYYFPNTKTIKVAFYLLYPINICEKDFDNYEFVPLREL